MRPRPQIRAVVVLVVAVVAACTPADGASQASSASIESRVASSTTSTSSSTSTSAPTSTSSAPTTTTAAPAPPPEFPHFVPDEYGRLVDALVPADTVLGTALAITGNEVADARIRTMAEARGYRVRPVTQVPMVAEAGVLVHPSVVADLRALRDEAHRLGLVLEVRSGYRSPERQRQIFEREVGEAAVARGRLVTPDDIAAGIGDDVVDAALAYHSIPGYSRHHSGFTVDFDAGGATLGEFEGSPTEEWLRADDFAVAKRFGFVPSYPRGSTPQGPQPEPWEFVWVGTGNIRCAALHIPMQAADAAASCPLVQ